MSHYHFTAFAVSGELNPECLPDEWSVETHQQGSRVLTFWDTFEWGLWFGGHLLYSCGDRYQLCIREDGWLGPLVCEETVGSSQQRFWGDFTTAPMRATLQGMLGLRGLAVVAEGTFNVCQGEVRNESGKIVCRLAWSSVSAGKRGCQELLHSCQVMPLLGYESEAARVAERLIRSGAKTSGEGPLDVLLRHGNRKPQKYTLRPYFGLQSDTPAREALGRIVRGMLAIAVQNLPGILDDRDTEFLHDYRVCLRKIRSVLSLIKDVYPTVETVRMRTLLGDLARQTNRLRDLDVYLLTRDEYLGVVPPVFRPTLDGMFDDFSAARKVELRRTTSKMRSKSNRQLLHEINACYSEETAHGPSLAADLSVGPLVFRCIYKRYRKIHRIAGDIKTETPDEMLHQLRIECKKLRYLMEFFSELIPVEDGSAVQKMLRRLQGRLGDFNDASVQQKSLLQYWEQKNAGPAGALGLGGLVSILYYRQQQMRTGISQALEEFCSGSTAAIFKRIFKLPAPVSATAAPQAVQP